MDALKMTHEDNKYDLVWACESGEHMPDKKKYVEEMTRVLKPGRNCFQGIHNLSLKKELSKIIDRIRCCTCAKGVTRLKASMIIGMHLVHAWSSTKKGIEGILI